MAKVFLASTDAFTVANSNTEVIGAGGVEVVTIATGVTGVVIDQNVERVVIGSATSALTFRQQGNQLVILNGTTEIVRFPVQTDSDGTLLTTTTGTMQVRIAAGGVMTLGGATVSATAGSVTPTTVDTTIRADGGSTNPPITAGFTLTSSSDTVNEGNSVTFTVTRTGDLTAAKTLAFNTTGDTAGGNVTAATIGTDANPVSGTVTFAAGSATATFTISATTDGATEGLEGLKVSIFDGATVVGSRTVLINDTQGSTTPTDNLSLNVTVADVIEGSGNIVYRLQLDRAPTAATTVNVSTGATGDTAGAGTDYVPVSQQVTFAIGETVKFVTVTVNDDVTYENSGVAETLTLNVSLPSNVTLAAGADLVAAITENDPNPASIPRATELTTGTDQFVGSDVSDVINGTQNTTLPGKLLSTSDFIDGKGGTDKIILTNQPGGGVVANTLADLDLTNVASVEVLETNYTTITLAGEAAEAGLATVDASTAGGGVNLDVSSAAYTLALTARLTNNSADTVAVNFAAGADSINTGTDATSATQSLDSVVISGVTNPVRVTFTSAEVGNGSSAESNTVAGQDGGLAVRLQKEDGSDGLTGDVARLDDEGLRLTGAQFDVRDISGTARGTFSEVLLGTAGADGAMAASGGSTSIYINGGAGNDAMTGTTGNDFLVGGAGNDTLNAGTGVDSVIGGAGNDRFVFGDLSADDAITGGAGDTDTLAVTLIANDAALGDAVYVNKTGIEVLLVDPASTDSLVITLGTNAEGAGISQVVLDAGYTLNAGTFTSGITVRDAAAGGETITTGSGADAVTSNNGNDSISTGDGNDIITLATGAGTTNVAAGAGNDTVFGGISIDAGDTLSGGSGADTLSIDGGAAAGSTGGAYAGAGISFGTSFTGFEALTLAAGLAPVDAASGNDTAGSANTYVIDVVNANIAAGTTLTVDGSALRAAVVTGLGADSIVGGLASDTTTDETLDFDASAVTTAAGSVSVLGGASADTIVGSANADVIGGNAGNDTLTGGAGADTITGGAGNDTIVGGAGTDSLDGGAGADTYIYAAIADLLAAEAVTDSGTGTDVDTIDLSTASAVGDAVFANKSGIEVLTINIGSTNGQTVTLSTNAQAAGIVRVNLDSGYTLAAGTYTVGLRVDDVATGNETVTTGGGADTINSVGGADSIVSGAGADAITLGTSSGNVNVDAGADNDTVTAGATVDANDTLNGGAGSDTLAISAGNTTGGTSTLTVAFGTGFTNFESITLAKGLDVVDTATTDTAGSANSYTVTLANNNIAAGAQLTVDASALRAAVVTNLGDTAVGGSGASSDTTTDEVLVFTAAAVTTTGSVNVTGGAASDNITATANADSVTAGGGNDTVTGGLGNDTLVGEAGNDALNGGAGADSLDGGAGNDTITLGAGNDTVVGGEGNDRFIVNVSEFNNELDTLAGNGGTNSLVITDDTAGAGTVNVVDVGFNGRYTDVTNVELVGDAASDTFTWVPGSFSQTAGVRSITVGANAIGNIDASNFTVGIALTGGAGADTLTGNAQADTISGGAGVDSITGGAGDDSIAEAGGDTISAGAGTDTVTLGTGAANVNVDMGAGDDVVVGGSTVNGNDTISGGTGADILRLDAGNTATGNVGYNLTFGANFTAFESIVLAKGLDVVDTATTDTEGSANDYTITLNAATVSAGTVFTVDASALRAAVVTGFGNDSVVGGTGSDSDSTTDENLILTAVNVTGTGSVSVLGGAAADQITGTANADAITGNGGADVIVAGDGNDTINGGDGADDVTGGAGVDSITLGAGADVLRYTAVAESTGANPDVVSDFASGTDVLAITQAGTTGGDVINVSGFASVASFSNGLVSLAGTSGVPVLGDGFYSAADGQLHIDANGDGQINQNNDLTVSISAVAAADLRFSVAGGTGADTITGGVGADTIGGDDGDDVITGGAGADVLTGGAGSDTFSFAAGASGTPGVGSFDEITDYGDGTDTIDFGATLIVQLVNVAGGAGTATVSAGGVVTFNAADNTLALRIAAVAQAMGTSAAGTAVVFAAGADSYVYITDGLAGTGANDVLVKLTGIAGAVGTDSLTLAGGDITGLE